MPASRLRLYDLLLTRFPSSIGVHPSDVARVALAANAVQERLLTCREGGDNGWYGGYAEMAFSLSQTAPYLTLPWGVARAIRFDACTFPIPLQNQFYEYLRFGSGHLPKSCGWTGNVCRAGLTAAYRRDATPTFVDLTTPGYGLRAYCSEAADVGKRVLISGLDANAQRITTLDGGVSIAGCFLSLQIPFQDLALPNTAVPLELSSISGIQKDITVGPVSLYQVNLTTGAQSLLVTLEPGQTVASYTRYYFDSLPPGCCQDPANGLNVQVTAMVKLDLIPVTVPTDYLLIQSSEAMIAEAQAMRFGDMDSESAKKQAAERHTMAVRYLQGQLVHYEGKELPAVSFAPFGSARLASLKIGTLT